MKRILVTGAGGGIGSATVRRYSAGLGAGCALLLTDIEPAALERVAAHARQAGATVETVQGDMAGADLPGRLVDAARARLGGLDIVISNAGTSRRGLLVDQEEEDWDAVMNVNARAFWRLARAAHPLLKESGGNLLAVASIAGSSPNPGTGFYSASKAALLSLVSQLGLEWALDGIRVNAVSPGVTLTPLNARQYEEDATLRSRREALVPLQRFASPDEIAAAIVFLAGPGAQFCQGYNLVVDGGLLPSVLAHSLPPVGARRRG